MKKGQLKLVGLRSKIFALCIFLEVVTVILFTTLGGLLLKEISKSSKEFGQEQQDTVRQTSGESMDHLVSSFLISYAISESEISNYSFYHVVDSVYLLAIQVQEIVNDPDNYGYKPVELPSRSNAGTPSAQLLYANEAAASDEKLNAMVSKLGNLQEQMIASVETNGVLKDIAIGLPGGATILCDASADMRFDEKGKIMDFDPTRRPWYQAAVENESMCFTDVTTDFYTGNSEISVGIPVYHNGQLMAVCCGSISLDTIENTVEQAHVGDNGFSCIINNEGRILFSNRKDGTMGLSNEADLRESDNAALADLVSDALSGNVDFRKLTIDDEPVCVTYAPLYTMGWTQLMIVPQDELDAPTQRLLDELDSVAVRSQQQQQDTIKRATIFMLILLLIMVGVAVVMSLLFSDRLVRPINSMTKRVQTISGEDMIFEVEDTYKTGDEIQILANAFHDMSEKTVKYINEITHITAEKERIDTELNMATNIQMGMVPGDMKKQKGFRIKGSMTPAKEVGGDFYDYFMIEDDHLAFMMADVSGKGVPAALFMAISKATIKSRAMTGGKPAEIFSSAQELISESNKEDLFVTVWLAIVDLKSGHMEYCSAGHEYPGIKRAGGRYEWLMDEDKDNNIALAMLPGFNFTGYEMDLKPGDRVFLYTDGVPEAINTADEQFGMDRTLDALNEVADDEDEDVLLNVWNRVSEYIGDEPQFDDTTMLSFTYLGPDDEGIERRVPWMTFSTSNSDLLYSCCIKNVKIFATRVKTNGVKFGKKVSADFLIMIFFGGIYGTRDKNLGK
ncbi:MAG: SpoIIE family protein phosphatase [Lachnospiraceae bacterium]|nr:SpoIIE family protein phosphatase [Lachnospiraceae bacterium]